jgi:hypothetical protein
MPFSSNSGSADIYVCCVCATAVIGSDCHTYFARRRIEREKTERKEYHLICETELMLTGGSAGKGWLWSSLSVYPMKT